MTKAEIRTAVRNITKEWSTDAGTLLPSGDVILDFFIEWAVEDVVLDLVPLMPESFLDYEDIDLVANQANYSLTAEWLQIWCMQKNVTDKNPVTIPYIDVDQRQYKEYVGETAEDPEGFYLDGDTIMFVPKPSTAKTDHVRCWIIVPEAATMATDGPVYIPRVAHKLIVLRAAILIAQMNDQIDTQNLWTLYRIGYERVTDIFHYRIQQQPRFLKGSFFEKQTLDTRDKAFYDLSGFFD